MFRLSRPKAAAVAVTALGVSLGMAAPALADIQPQANDVVVAGSDTTQYAANFLFDGDTTGDGGYNQTARNRVFSFDAVGDASGRTSYANNANGAAAFAATSVMRAGTNPVLRPLGSGAGIGSLYNAPYTTLGAAPGYVGVQIARSSRLPKCSESTAAGGFHLYQMGTEPLTMAKLATGSNAPAGLNINDLLKIYTGVWTTWGQVAAQGGAPSGATIDPLIPPTTSGTYGVFYAALTQANGGVAPTIAGYVETVVENDFNAFNIATSPANAIAPFSGARITLNNSGYFGSGVANGQNAVVPMTGSGPGGAAWQTTRPVFMIVKQADVVATKKFQPGGTQNYVEALLGANGAMADPAYQANISAAGFNAVYQDLGTVSQANGNCT